MKTCVLFGGLFADGQTIVREPIRSRDHTEIALREFGADLNVRQRVITLKGRPTLTGRELIVPERSFVGGVFSCRRACWFRVRTS